MTQYFPVGSMEVQCRYCRRGGRRRRRRRRGAQVRRRDIQRNLTFPSFGTVPVRYLAKTGRHVHRNGILYQYGSRAECNSFRKNMGMGTFHYSSIEILVNTGGPLFSGISSRESRSSKQDERLGLRFFTFGAQVLGWKISVRLSCTGGDTADSVETKQNIHNASLGATIAAS